MSKPDQKQFELLRDDFVRASCRWPSLHHAFIQLGGRAKNQPAMSGMGEVNFFLKDWTRTIVAPIAGKGGILEITPSMHDSLASELSGFTVYYDDGPCNPSGLRQFERLALSACRCLFPKVVANFNHCYGHRSFLPDMWLGELYTLGQEHHDPLLTVREHHLELGKDEDTFLLYPGYSGQIPRGDVTGYGRSRPWKDLLADLAKYGVDVDVLERDVFSASAYVLEMLMASRWHIGSTAGKRSRGKRGRPREYDEEKDEKLVYDFEASGLQRKKFACDRNISKEDLDNTIRRVRVREERRTN